MERGNRRVYIAFPFSLYLAFPFILVEIHIFEIFKVLVYTYNREKNFVSFVFPFLLFFFFFLAKFVICAILVFFMK